MQHVSNLISSLGCDSIITTMVAVKPVYAINENVSVCSGSSYTFPDNFTQSNITAPMQHVSNLISSLGCDSIITTMVAVKPVYAINENVSVCSGSSYTFPDNFTQSNITAPMQHVSNLVSSLGCDSIITTIVALIPVDTSVIKKSIHFAALATNAQFQWLDCDQGYQWIAGATDSLFVAQVNGHYAVLVFQNGCQDTSACYEVYDVGIKPLYLEQCSVFPNPTRGNATLSIPGVSGQKTIRMIDSRGIIISEFRFFGEEVKLETDHLPVGLYMLELTCDNFADRHVLKLQIMK